MQLPMDDIDSVMLIDANYKVLHAIRIGCSPDGKSYIYQGAYTGKNIFNIFTDIPHAESSYTEATQTCRPVFRHHQKYTDYTGNVFFTDNLTIPLLYRGKITGFLGLSKDVTSIQNIKVDIDSSASASLYAPTSPYRAEDVSFGSILTEDPTMMDCIRLAEKLAQKDDPILIYGETGTGKELFAQAIMNRSGVPRSRIVTQNCASIPDNLIESILFGTTKGSFTGAENKEGLFEMAKDGILFLDELNSLPFHIQGNLLRVIQDGTYRAVGSQKEKKTNARVIATMNIHPLKAIEQQILRKDLFFRFTGGLISIPPLRKRPADIELYLREFVPWFSAENRKPVKPLSPEVRNILLQYRYEGNVRELKHIINFMINDSDTPYLTVKNLPAYLIDIIEEAAPISAEPPAPETPAQSEADSILPSEEGLNLPELIESVERRTIHKALRRSNGNIADAARLLGISRQSLSYKLGKYKIQRSDYKISSWTEKI